MTFSSNAEQVDASDGRNNSFLRRTFFSLVHFRNYRLVWFGSCTEHLGEWMELAAILWLLNELTHSPFLLVLAGSFRYLPITFFAFIGGVVADRVNRKYLLIATLIASALLSLTLAIFVHTGVVTIWHILIIALLGGVVTGFNHPARQTIVPNVVEREYLLNAITLDSGSVMASRVIGTPLAGYIIAHAGVTPILGLRALGALLAIIWLIPAHIPPTPKAARRKAPLRNLMEGLGYVRGHTIVLTLVTLYVLSYFVTNSYTSLFPIFAVDVLRVGASGYGFLHAAPGLGSLLATLSLAALTGFRHKGWLLFLAGMTMGVALIGFSLSSWFLLSLFLLAIVGGMNTAFTTTNNTLIQTFVPDEVRGRVMSLREVAFGLGPSLGLVAGVFAERSGAPLAVGAVGFFCVVIVLSLAFRLPKVRRLE
jgi:MFS family permease